MNCVFTPHDAVASAQHSDKTDVLQVDTVFMARWTWMTFSTGSEFGFCSFGALFPVAETAL